MGSRFDLHEILVQKLGSRFVYFQPPASLQMTYPAIVYSRSKIENRFANNSVYGQNYLYTITVIDRDPDSEIVSRVSLIPRIRHDRSFTSDNLNHDVFTLIY